MRVSTASSLCASVGALAVGFSATVQIIMRAVSPGTLKGEIESFLRSCRLPAALEQGEPPFPLQPDFFALEARQADVLLEVWDDKRHLARRIRSIEQQRPGRLQMCVERFGGKPGSLTLVDLDRPQNAPAVRAGERSVFLEQFRRFVSRQFPRWTIRELTNGADLCHTLSPSYPRALLSRGTHAVAALAASPDHADHALAFGLIWLDHLRQLHRRLTVESLALFLPLGNHKTTCLRLRHLNAGRVRPLLFLYDESGFEQQADPADHGNLETQLFPADEPVPRILCGPEAQLEACVRREIQVVDAGLLPEPVYGQVCSLAGLDRGLLDLLAVDRSGRLAVIELKASEDVQLPVQALDYWMRVAWHARQGEFRRAGYFPGIEIRTTPPRLFLVAPALQFHPRTETLLSYIDPAVPVERVGLSVEWQHRLRVVFRAELAVRPDGR